MQLVHAKVPPVPDPLGFALIGCGRIAARHAELLGSGAVEGARLVAVCDPNMERARAIGATYDVPAFAHMQAMMDACSESIHVLTILTESGNHAGHCLEAVPYGKHIVVEKPMALSLEDADAMIAACQSAGLKLFVVKQNRFNLPILKLKEALDQGRFGTLVMGGVRVRWSRTQEYYDTDAWRGTWALDGGVLANQASHHIDLLIWLMGEVEQVFALGATRNVDIEAENTAAAVLRFRSGAIGSIEATTAARPVDLEGSISILGEKGTVEIGGFAANQLKTWQFVEARPGDAEAFGQTCENPPDVYGFGHRAYLSAVIDAIRDDGLPTIDGFEGRKSLEIIAALYESMETGRAVSLATPPSPSRLGRKQ